MLRLNKGEEINHFMRYATKEIIINPLEPVKQAGHIQQVNPVSQVHDDLKARIIALEDEHSIFIHFSSDLLGLSHHYTEEINQFAKAYFPKETHIVLSTTHTHYAGDTTNDSYHKQLILAFQKAIQSLQWKEGVLSYSYQYEPFEKVGKSRISHHEAFVLLGLLTIYDHDQQVITLIHHNCHPTILSATQTDYFSAEYVGCAIHQLQQDHFGFISYLQGACGDISTRFTRPSQDEEAVKYLAGQLVAKIRQMKKSSVTKIPMNTLQFESKLIPIEYDDTPIDLSYMPNDLSNRELETIEYGKIMRQRLFHDESRRQTIMEISKVSLGKINLIFAPNELFSDYLRRIDYAKSILVCYSNGYSPYIPPIDHIIYTYETFTDILATSTKQKMLDCLIEFSK